MTREPQDREELDPDELRQLAARIADRIVTGGDLDRPLAEILAAARKCPEGHLCCFNGYKCFPAAFFCPQNFRCAGGFIGTSTGAQL